MNIKNRITAILILISLCLFNTANAMTSSSSNTQTLYAPDGRSIEVQWYEIHNWIDVGWYTYHVVTMYAPDGRSLVIAETDVTVWENVGWIDGRKTTTIYAADGRSATIPLWQLQSYLNVGWYEYPPSPYQQGGYNPGHYPQPGNNNSSLYYPNTDIPTYTSVTGVRLKELTYTQNGYPLYRYNYTSSRDVAAYLTDLEYTYGFTKYSGDVETTPSTYESSFYKGNTIILINVHFDFNEVWVAFSRS